MGASTDYQPPTTSEMIVRQNEANALRLLVAQRRFYGRAKRWLGVRWLGIAVIGIGAPAISVIWPRLAVASGAVAGTWIFLARTLLLGAQGSRTGQAAAVQEQFDFFVFGMTSTGKRSTSPSLEEIAAIAGPDDAIHRTARKENLIDWYPFDVDDPGNLAIAIAQRASASYSDRLIRATAVAWCVATGAWIAILVTLSVVYELSLSTFLLGVVLPVLPAFLDLVQYVAAVWRSATDRSDLADSIEMQIDAGSIQAEDLLVWQERLFDLRRSAPQVPDWIYWMKRKVNERSMHSAARQLSRRFKSSDLEARSPGEVGDGDDH